MARDHKHTLRLNDCEHYYLSRYSMGDNVSQCDYIRTLIHNHILSREGKEAAVNLLRGQPPEHR